jgi:hypothetical protein
MIHDANLLRSVEKRAESGLEPRRALGRNADRVNTVALNWLRERENRRLLTSPARISFARG